VELEVSRPLAGTAQMDSSPAPVGRGISRAPFLAWRLGLGVLLGHRFVLITTRERRSGLPRRVVLEYGALRGKLYVISGFGSQADWHKDLCDDPYVMVQTWQGPEPMQAWCVTDDAEIRDVCALFMQRDSAAFRRSLHSLAIRPDSLEEMMAHKDRLAILRFDPTEERVPSPREADLVWVWPLLAAVAVGRAWAMQPCHKGDED